MYVRFETPYYCVPTGQPLGVFWAEPTLRLRKEVPTLMRHCLEDTLEWFNIYLRVPTDDEIDRRAIFWFSARSAMVSRMWCFVRLLRNEGAVVRMRWTRTAGRIVYRDDHQIAAIPYGHGRRPRKVPVLRFF